jgi:hypothetical protein
MKPQPLKEGRTKGNVKKHISEGRQAPPPKPYPQKVAKIEIKWNY